MVHAFTTDKQGREQIYRRSEGWELCTRYQASGERRRHKYVLTLILALMVDPHLHDDLASKRETVAAHTHFGTITGGRASNGSAVFLGSHLDPM